MVPHFLGVTYNFHFKPLNVNLQSIGPHRGAKSRTNPSPAGSGGCRGVSRKSKMIVRPPQLAPRGKITSGTHSWYFWSRKTSPLCRNSGAHPKHHAHGPPNRAHMGISSLLKLESTKNISELIWPCEHIGKVFGAPIIRLHTAPAKISPNILCNLSDKAQFWFWPSSPMLYITLKRLTPLPSSNCFWFKSWKIVSWKNPSRFKKNCKNTQVISKNIFSKW